MTLIGDKVDRYDRTVSKVMVSGVDCNLREVVLGLAWHYKAYAREQSTLDRDAYANAELDARKARSGLWADSRSGSVCSRFFYILDASTCGFATAQSKSIFPGFSGVMLVSSRCILRPTGISRQNAITFAPIRI